MAGKYALYLPYKVLDSLSSGNVTDSEFREFIKGLAEYDRTGMFPASRTAGFTMMYELLRSDLDFAKAKYEDIVKKRSQAGKQGGAPLGNQNAKKNPSKQKSDSEPEQAKQAKQADNSNQLTDKRSSGSKTEKPPPPLLLNVKSKIAEHGFFLDNSDIESLIQATNADWFEGHDFIDFIVETFREGGYRNKPKREQHNLFRKLLFDAQNLREEFPEWRNKKIGEAAAEEEHRQRETDAQERRKRIDQARANKPKACGHCGTALYPENEHGTCPSCGFGFFFDETSEAYTFQEPQESFAAIFNRHMKSRGKGQSEVMEAVS